MSQSLRPNSDIDTASWLRTGGGSYYTQVNESTPNDATFITSVPLTSGTIKFGLTNPSGTPPVLTGHIIHARCINAVAGAVQINDTTNGVVASFTPTLLATDDTYELEEAEAAQISDYNTLELWIDSPAVGTASVSQTYFEVPSAQSIIPIIMHQRKMQGLS